MSRQPSTTVVIATRDRRASLLVTLGKLEALPERPPVILVDNGSSDGTVEAVRRHHPGVEIVALWENLGCGARTLGVRRAATPYVAFSDDDSWWAPGSLDLAAELLDRHPRLALVAARVLVGPRERLDALAALMRSSPLPGQADLPGRRVLGFLACGAVVRRAAFLDVGGFDRRLGIGGEEELLALDLAAAGWGLAYSDEVVAHHHPSPTRDPARRRRTQARNALWVSWLRHRAPAATARTGRVLRAGARDAAARAGLIEAARGLRWVLRERRPVPRAVAADLRRLRAGTGGGRG